MNSLRANKRVKLAIALMAASGLALTLLAFWPGYLTNDATYVYGFIKEWRFGDWQSPLMSMLWWLIDPIAPGPGSMLLLIACLYWLGFALVALAVARRSVWIGLAVPVLALMPPAIMLLAMIWRDMLFAVAWLVAGAIVYVTVPASRGRWVAQAIALALVGFGVLLRPTAIVAAPLIAAYVLWPVRFDWKRTALVFVPGVVLGYALIHLVYYVVLDVKRENPGHSLFVFDLGGITHFTGENQFPVTWNAEQTALLTSTCYNPERWDVYWTLEPCRFVMQRLEAPGDVIFGTTRLRDAWLKAITAHPLAYLQHRLAYFWTFLSDANLTLELYQVDDPARTPLARSSAFKTVLALHDALKTTILFRTGFWLLAAILLAAAGWRSRATPSGAFAIGMAASGTAVVVSFLPFGVACDFRYGYWCVPAVLAGLGAALVAPREHDLVADPGAVRATA